MSFLCCVVYVFCTFGRVRIFNDDFHIVWTLLLTHILSETKLCVASSSSTFQPCNSNLLCVIIWQLPSHPVHREPLQCTSAKEDGPVPDWDPGWQTGPVQHQSRRVWTAAVARNTEGQDPCQGKVRLWAYHKAHRSTVWMFEKWVSLSSGDYLSSQFYYLQSEPLKAHFKGRR